MVRLGFVYKKTKSLPAHADEGHKKLSLLTGLNDDEMVVFSDAVHSTHQSRRATLWDTRALDNYELPLFAHAQDKFRPGANSPNVTLVKEPQVLLPQPMLGEDVMLGYERLRLSLKAHPMELFRAALARAKMITAKRLEYTVHGTKVRVVGLVLNR